MNSNFGHSLDREAALKVCLAKAKKEIVRLRKKVKKNEKNGGSFLPRALSDDFLRKNFSMPKVISTRGVARSSAQPLQSELSDEGSSIQRRCMNRRNSLSSCGTLKGASSDYCENLSFHQQHESSSCGNSSSYLTTSVGESLTVNDLLDDDMYGSNDDVTNGSRHSSIYSFFDILGLSQHGELQRTSSCPDEESSNNNARGKIEQNIQHNETKGMKISKRNQEANELQDGQLGGEEPQEVRHDMRQQNIKLGILQDCSQQVICPLEFEALKAKLRRRERDIELLENEIVQNTRHVQELLLSFQKKEM